MSEYRYTEHEGRPGIDGLAAGALRKEVGALRAEIDRRAAATAGLLAVVRAVAAWEDGTGRADLLEALDDYDRALAGAEREQLPLRDEADEGERDEDQEGSE